MNFRKVKYLVVLLTIFCLPAYAQEPKDCEKIDVEAKSTNPKSSDASDGRILLTFRTHSFSHYKIFISNTTLVSTQVKEDEIKNLRAGFYDILIIDPKGCHKQITVILK